MFSPERDTTWTGQPKVEHDWLGRPQEDRDWLGRPTQSSSGETLYRRSGGGSSSSSSTSGAEALLVLILAVAVLAVGLIGVVIVATPIIAPILLTTAESAKKRGDMVEFKKWENWGTAASVIGLLVVIVIAGAIGITLFGIVVSLAQNTTSSALVGLAYVLAVAVGLGATALSLVTGISPTAIVYLRHKEAQLRTAGKTATAVRVRRLNWAIGIVAAITVGLALIIVVVLAVIAIGTSLLTG